VRVGANVVETTTCAGRIGELEKSIRNYSVTREEHIVEPALGMKNEFRSEFHKVVNHMLTTDEFEIAWALPIEKYNLKTHPFIT
jgi:hypothetical protein